MVLSNLYRKVNRCRPVHDDEYNHEVPQTYVGNNVRVALIFQMSHIVNLDMWKVNRLVDSEINTN